MPAGHRHSPYRKTDAQLSEPDTAAMAHGKCNSQEKEEEEADKGPTD